MKQTELENAVQQAGGVMSIAELARFTHKPKSLVREIASEIPGIRMIGGAYILNLESAQAICDELEADDWEDVEEPDADDEDDELEDDEFDDEVEYA